MLRVEGVSMIFSGFAALSDVDLSVEKGEIRALIGANGAGKSTLLNVISGLLPGHAGKVLFEERDESRRNPSDLVLGGMSRSFQITSVFEEFSAFENVQIAVLAFRRQTVNLLTPAVRLGRGETQELLDAVGIAHLADQPAGELAAGDRKRLEFAIALAARPKMLLLDEPTAGMAPQERKVIVDLLSMLNRDEGVTILFTEHDLEMVGQLAHRISVLHQGRILAEGLPGEISQNAEVQAAYVGGHRNAAM